MPGVFKVWRSKGSVCETEAVVSLWCSELTQAGRGGGGNEGGKEEEGVKWREGGEKEREKRTDCD